MTIKELSNDKCFLEGLRNREFCLVLGAGFSFGLKNNTTSNSLPIARIEHNYYNTIPLVTAYVELARKIFESSVNRGETAANTWENNNFAIKKDDVVIDLKGFYKDLFTLDEDWFKENRLNLFKSILIPDWYQVYTFNFDNVFETIVKLKGRNNFYSLHFPEHEGDVDRRTGKIAIHHLHGYILETAPENLTFSQNTYDILDNSPHTLYDPFYVDIASGRKLLIIGCQFDERTIDKKFFEGLKNKKITIYHFSRDNDDFRTKPGIAGNPNYHFVKIADTSEVLNFFKEHRSRIEKINIDGADVINSDFIRKVKEEGTQQGFTASDFYLAKQLDECQWFGATQNWVVERDNYQHIKKEVISSFSEPRRVSKISALIWGKGGSGKSTLLRKLAIDLNDEEFAVLWIKDKEIQLFYEKGLSQLREFYPYKQFLIVIEDLYRVKQQDIKLKVIVDSICGNENVRLIVGDRKNDDTSYKEHIYNPDKNVFELTVDDNKKTLCNLLVNIPKWKETAELLLTTDKDYKSTLYYILWTIGRTAQKNEKNNTNLQHAELTSHFRSIVQSDLKALSLHYPGIAKMLYYWASIYTKSKIYISYDLFFELSELFKAPSTTFSNLINASATNKSILDNYVYKATGFIEGAGKLPLLAFNQDILAEDGLSKSKLSDWHPFDNSIILTMLPIIINNGDGFSASSFLSHCLRFLPDFIFTKDEKRKYVNELRSKDNMGGYLYHALKGNLYSDAEKIDLARVIINTPKFWELESSSVVESLILLNDKDKAETILSQENFWNLPSGIVTTALNISNGKADKILSQENFWNLNKDIVSTALNISKDKDKADKILSQENFWKELPFEIVSTALNISKDKDKADQILSQENFWKELPSEIVSTALNISKDKGKADKILSQENFSNLKYQVISTALNISKDKDKADKILSQENFWNLTNQVVSTALNISKDKDKADKILSQDNFWKELPSEIVSTALNISKDKGKADIILSQENFWKELPFEIVTTALNISKDKDKADEILSQENFWNLPYQIVSTALNISKDKDKANKVLSQENFLNLSSSVVSTALNISKNKDKADKILSEDILWNLNNDIVSMALNISKNDRLIEKFGKELLESARWKEKWSMTYHILHYYSKQKKIPKQVEKICYLIITEYLDKNISDKGKYMRYINLMKIPFHSLPDWKKSSLVNIKRWGNRQRNLVTNTIIAFTAHPGEIKRMCEMILNHWREELRKPIYQLGRKSDPHFGDHIRLSMGHPELKELITKTAIEIDKTESTSPCTIPDHLITVVKQIINEKIYPVWERETDDS